jgi:MFS transporter, ACS family, glucarate transporter
VARKPFAQSARWWVMSALSGFALVSYMARVNISVAAEAMIPALGISHVQMGQIFTAFLIGYAIFQVPGGALGDRFGARLTLGVSALIWSAATLMTGLLPLLFHQRMWVTFVLLWIIRFLLGASEGTTFPVGNRVVRNWMPPHLRALGNSIMFTGTSIASAATAPLVSRVVNRWGWQASFYVTAFPAVVIAILWLWLARDRPAGIAGLQMGEGPAAAQKPLSALIRERNVLLLIASYVSEGYVLFIFVFWLYIYLVEKRGFSMLRGGWIAALPWLTAMVLTPFGGIACDRIARRRGRLAGAKVVIMIGYGISGGMLFLAAYADSRWLAVGGLSLSIAALMAAESSFWSSAVHLAQGPVGLLSGIMNTAGIVGGIISTSLTPLLVQRFNWGVALASGTAMALLCVALWSLVKNTPQ